MVSWERQAPRVRREGLRGKFERWAPTTAMSIVLGVVAVSWAIGKELDGVGGEREGDGCGYLESIAGFPGHKTA